MSDISFDEENTSVRAALQSSHTISLMSGGVDTLPSQIVSMNSAVPYGG